MTKNTDTISFVNNATTREALVYIGRFALVVVRNTARAVNRAAHRWPWAFIFAVLLVSTVTCHIIIGQARAERDRYNKENVHLMQQVASYRAAFGEKGGAK